MANVLFMNTGIFHTSIWYFTCQLCTCNQCLMDFFSLSPGWRVEVKLSRNDWTSTGCVGRQETCLQLCYPAAQKCLGSGSSFQKLCLKELLCC